MAVAKTSIEKELTADLFASFYLSRGDPSVQMPVFGYLGIYHTQERGDDHAKRLGDWLLANQNFVFSVPLAKKHIAVSPSQISEETNRFSREYLQNLASKTEKTIGQFVADFTSLVLVEDSVKLGLKPSLARVVPPHTSLFREHILLQNMQRFRGSPGVQQLLRDSAQQLPENLSTYPGLKDTFIDTCTEWEERHPHKEFDPCNISKLF